MNVVHSVLGSKGVVWLGLWAVVLAFVVGLFIANWPPARTRTTDAHHDEEDWIAFDEGALSGRILIEMGRIRVYWAQERRMLAETLRRRRGRGDLLFLAKELLVKGGILLLLSLGLGLNAIVLIMLRLWVLVWRKHAPP